MTDAEMIQLAVAVREAAVTLRRAGQVLRQELARRGVTPETCAEALAAGEMADCVLARAARKD